MNSRTSQDPLRDRVRRFVREVAPGLRRALRTATRALLRKCHTLLGFLGSAVSISAYANSESGLLETRNLLSLASSVGMRNRRSTSSFTLATCLPMCVCVCVCGSISVSVSAFLCLCGSVALCPCDCLSVCVCLCLRVSVGPWLPACDCGPVCLCVCVSKSVRLSKSLYRVGMSVCPCALVPLFLLVRLPVCQCACLPVWLCVSVLCARVPVAVCLFVRPSVRPSVSLSVCLSVSVPSLSVSLCPSLRRSISALSLPACM